MGSSCLLLGTSADAGDWNIRENAEKIRRER
jgi:hypothetical protein